MSDPKAPIHRASLIVLCVAAVASIAIDQVTKWIALRYLTPGRSVELLGRWFQLRLIFNSGAAFSLGTGQTWIFTVMALAVIVFVAVNIRRLNHPWWALAMGLLLGGAAGNLIDRLFRKPAFGSGHVVDFLDYNNWFIGNVADIVICVTAVIIVVLLLRSVPLTLANAPAETPPADAVDEHE